MPYLESLHPSSLMWPPLSLNLPQIVARLVWFGVMMGIPLVGK